MRRVVYVGAELRLMGGCVQGACVASVIVGTVLLGGRCWSLPDVGGRLPRNGDESIK